MANYKNFFNEVSKNNRIITREEIGSMTPDEFEREEAVIREQWGKIGIPTNEEMAFSEDVIYVRAYFRDDGTEVKGHYRSKPGKNVVVRNERKYPLDSHKEPIYEDLNPNQSISSQAEEIPSTVDKSPQDTLSDLFIFLYKQLLNKSLPELLENNKNIIDSTKDILNNLNAENVLNNIPANNLQTSMDKVISFFSPFSPNGSSLWNIASKDIEKNMDYITKNGQLYDSISNLNFSSEVKNIIKEQVQTQFGLNDCQGIVFHENSNIAQKILKSNALKNFLIKNTQQLVKNGIIKNSSMGFDVKQDSDLWSALGKVKVIEAKLNKDSFEMLLSDTYDFNKDSRNPLVIMGRRVQDANLLVPYFTIIKIKFKF